MIFPRRWDGEGADARLWNSRRHFPGPHFRELRGDRAELLWLLGQWCARRRSSWPPRNGSSRVAPEDAAAAASRAAARAAIRDRREVARRAALRPGIPGAMRAIRAEAV